MPLAACGSELYQACRGDTDSVWRRTIRKTAMASSENARLRSGQQKRYVRRGCEVGSRSATSDAAAKWAAEALRQTLLRSGQQKRRDKHVEPAVVGWGQWHGRGRLDRLAAGKRARSRLSSGSSWGGWLSALAQLGVVVLIVFGARYGWRHAPAVLLTRAAAMGRLALGLAALRRTWFAGAVPPVGRQSVILYTAATTRAGRCGA